MSKTARNISGQPVQKHYKSNADHSNIRERFKGVDQFDSRNKKTRQSVKIARVHASRPVAMLRGYWRYQEQNNPVKEYSAEELEAINAERESGEVEKLTDISLIDLFTDEEIDTMALGAISKGQWMGADLKVMPISGMETNHLVGAINRIQNGGPLFGWGHGDEYLLLLNAELESRRKPNAV